MAAPLATVELAYALHPLPPSRLGRRWRWELWHGARLLAAGWRLSPGHAERALRAAASRFGHARLGLIPLDPARTTGAAGFLPGATVRLDCGAVTCILVPRVEDQRFLDRAAAA